MIEKSQRADSAVLWGVAGVAFALVIIGLLLDFKPWKRFASRKSSTLATENAPVAEADMLQKLWIEWELVEKYQREGFPNEEAAARQRLAHLADWPTIAENACRLFGHAAFTYETWKRLECWLLDGRAANREAMYRLSRKRVAELLREAAEKQ